MSLWTALTAPFRRAPRRPLAQRRPERADSSVPLGMEALDLKLVEQVNSRNNSLERANTVPIGENKRGGFLSVTEPKTAPMPEDETYSKRFFEAFQIKRKTQ